MVGTLTFQCILYALTTDVSTINQNRLIHHLFFDLHVQLQVLRMASARSTPPMYLYKFTAWVCNIGSIPLCRNYHDD